MLYKKPKVQKNDRNHRRLPALAIARRGRWWKWLKCEYSSYTVLSLPFYREGPRQPFLLPIFLPELDQMPQIPKCQFLAGKIKFDFMVLLNQCWPFVLNFWSCLKVVQIGPLYHQLKAIPQILTLTIEKFSEEVQKSKMCYRAPWNHCSVPVGRRNLIMLSKKIDTSW